MSHLYETLSIFHLHHVSRFTLFWHNSPFFGTILAQLLRPACPRCHGMTTVKMLDMTINISIRSCNFHTITISVYTITISRVTGGSCIQHLYDHLIIVPQWASNSSNQELLIDTHYYSYTVQQHLQDFAN